MKSAYEIAIDGGKQVIMGECLKDTKTFLSDNSFIDGWKAAREDDMVKMKNHVKFAKR